MSDTLTLSSHLTEYPGTAKKISMRRWTLFQYRRYMRIALLFSIIPAPFQIYLAIQQLNYYYYDWFIIEVFGTLFMFCRSYLIFMILLNKKPDVESVENAMKTVVFVFIYYLIQSFLLFSLSNVISNELFNTTWKDVTSLFWTYNIVNVLINAPDFYVLFRLRYYLIYDFDDGSSDIDESIFFEDDDNDSNLKKSII